MTQPQTAAGWHADPNGDPLLDRWWDGQAWTEATQPAPHEIAMQRLLMAQMHQREAQHNTNRLSVYWLVVFVLAVLVAIVLGGIAVH